LAGHLLFIQKSPVNSIVKFQFSLNPYYANQVVIDLLSVGTLTIIDKLILNTKGNRK